MQATATVNRVSLAQRLRWSDLIAPWLIRLVFLGVGVLVGLYMLAPRQARASRIFVEGTHDAELDDRDDRDLRVGDLGERVTDYIAGMTDRYATRLFSELAVPTGELGWTLPRTGGVGVPDRVHARRLSGRLALILDMPSESYRRPGRRAAP